MGICIYTCKERFPWPFCWLKDHPPNRSDKVSYIVLTVPVHHAKTLSQEQAFSAKAFHASPAAGALVLGMQPQRREAAVRC